MGRIGLRLGFGLEQGLGLWRHGGLCSRPMDSRLQRAFGLASPNRYAGGLCPSRNPCYTLRGNDTLNMLRVCSEGPIGMPHFYVICF